jgi:hypothetical protein
LEKHVARIFPGFRDEGFESVEKEVQVLVVGFKPVNCLSISLALAAKQTND